MMLLPTALMKLCNRRVFVDVAQLAVANHPGHRREREIRIDRAGAVSDQQAEMHHLARLAGLDDQSHARARPLANQMMMHGAGREQAGIGAQLRIHAAIRQNDYRVARFDRVRRAFAKLRRSRRAVPLHLR